MFPRIDKGPIEYFLEIGKAYNTEARRECVRFHFQTIEEFNHFKYSISVVERSSDGKLTFILKGLTTGGLSLPGTGRAESKIDLFDLDGTYHVTVSKPGDVTNSFILKKENAVLHLIEDISDDSPFLDVTIRHT